MSFKNIFPNNNLSDMNDVLWANRLYSRDDMQIYTKFNRFGTSMDPYWSITGCREYLFFTKPDLNIVNPKTDTLNPELSGQVYFHELLQRYPNVITQLQSSNGIENGNTSPFMTVLSNYVNNSLDVSSISASTIDTPQTIYGTSYNYRGWGYTSDEKHDFSLEFLDTKYLEIYNLIKAYEEYERLKHIGLVTPPNIDNAPVVNGKAFSYYIRNKILHDQFSIYKFIIDDDGESILYYAKLWGVFFKSVPRDAFSDLTAENGGIKYSVEFEAAFIDDMNPIILSDFNQIVYPYINNTSYSPVYDVSKRMINGSWAKIPYVVKVNKDADKTWNGPDNMSHKYKLTWRV